MFQNYSWRTYNQYKIKRLLLCSFSLDILSNSIHTCMIAHNIQFSGKSNTLKILSLYTWLTPYINSKLSNPITFLNWDILHSMRFIFVFVSWRILWHFTKSSSRPSTSFIQIQIIIATWQIPLVNTELCLKTYYSQ